MLESCCKCGRSPKPLFQDIGDIDFLFAMTCEHNPICDECLITGFGCPLCAFGITNQAEGEKSRGEWRDY